MIDVFVEMPGASPAEVEQRRDAPDGEAALGDPRRRVRLLHVEPGRSRWSIVRFLSARTKSGARPAEPEARGAMPTASRPALAAARQAALDRRRADPRAHAVGRRATTTSAPPLAAQLHDAIKEVPDVSEVTLIGGRPRADRASSSIRRGSRRYALDPLDRAQALGGANAAARRRRAGRRRQPSARRRGRAAVGSVAALRDVGRRRVASGAPMLVRDVADVADGDARADRLRAFRARGDRRSPGGDHRGRQAQGHQRDRRRHRRRGEARRPSRPVLLPGDVHVTVTRDYGETAAEKSNELLCHMLLAVVSVSRPDRARARASRSGRRARSPFP